MRRTRTRINRATAAPRARSTGGASLEYSILIGAIAVAVLGALTIFGDEMSDRINEIGERTATTAESAGQ